MARVPVRRSGLGHLPEQGAGARRRGGTLARWHRRAGLVTAALVAWLALTGIALNHTQGLALDARYVTSRWLLAGYGLTPPEQVVSYRVGEDWVSQVGERLYLNAREIDGEYHSPLVGAVALKAWRVIGVEGRLLVLTPQGELLETLGGAHGVPAGMLALGVHAGRHLVVRAAHGDYLADEELLTWQQRRAIEAEWARTADTPPLLRQALLEAYRGRMLRVERVLRDLHSGRLLGRYGHLLMDLAAAGFLFLAASGLGMWFLRKNNQRWGGKS